MYFDERTIAAIELTDTNPTVFFPLAQSPEVRQAALVVAPALSVLRDPADSSLDD